MPSYLHPLLERKGLMKTSKWRTLWAALGFLAVPAAVGAD